MYRHIKIYYIKAFKSVCLQLKAILLAEASYNLQMHNSHAQAYTLQCTWHDDHVYLHENEWLIIK